MSLTERHDRRLIPWLLLGMNLCLAACTPVERLPSRTMSVTQGPDKVFAQPVEQIMPLLAGAAATGNNGRVGNELVFWEYRLADSGNANLFACVNQPEVNCEGRLARICPGGGQELARDVQSGLVRQLHCRAVGVAGIGDLRPGCEDVAGNYELLVGLMQCR